MEFQDRILKCVDCGAEFVWTAGEQQFFADKNFKNEPKRCKTCKTQRVSRPAGPSGRERVETTTTALETLGRKLPIIPGMQAQVDVITGSKTVLAYLSKPLVAMKENAFRER